MTENGLLMDVDPDTKDLDLYSVNPSTLTACLHYKREPCRMPASGRMPRYSGR